MSDNLDPLIVPRVNLNGNTARSLVEQVSEVLKALTKVKAALASAGGDLLHGRNYQSFDLPNEMRNRAEDAWRERSMLIEDMSRDFTDLALAIQDQEHSRN